MSTEFELPSGRTREEVMAAPVIGDFAIEHWRKPADPLATIYWDLATLWLEKPEEIYVINFDALGAAMGCHYMRISRYVGPSRAEGATYNGWKSIGLWSADTGVTWNER